MEIKDLVALANAGFSKNEILSLVQPGVAQPGVAQPGVAQPGVAQPGVAQPGVAQPGVTQPVVTQPGVTQPGVTQTGVIQTPIAPSEPVKPVNGAKVPENVLSILAQMQDNNLKKPETAQDILAGFTK